MPYYRKCLFFNIYIIYIHILSDVPVHEPITIDFIVSCDRVHLLRGNKTEIRDENDEIVFMENFHSVVLQNQIIILMAMFLLVL